MWRRIARCVAQCSDTALRTIAELTIALRRKIIVVSIDRVAANGAIPCLAIVRANLIDAAFGIVSMIAVREFANVALVLADLVAAAGAIPSPIILTPIVVDDPARIRGVR